MVPRDVVQTGGVAPSTLLVLPAITALAARIARREGSVARSRMTG